MSIPFVEFFAGIGGFAAAARQYRVKIVAAFDQDESARTVYQRHFGPANPIDLCGLGTDHRLVGEARGWWMSPPCQPYSRKGKQKDINDPRARALTHLTSRLADYRPDYVMVENVPPFGQSRSRKFLVEKLHDLGLHVVETTLCPTDFGIPNRRLRYYLLARPQPFTKAPPYPVVDNPLSHYLDHGNDQALLPDDLVARLDPVNNLVDADGIPGVFGSSYGRAIHGAGDYLRVAGGVRRFSPEEILSLLHFPATHSFPEALPLRARYKLAGNSVNVAVVDYLIGWLLS